MALTTEYVAMVCAPAGPAVADVGDPDPGGGNATTWSTVDTTPTTLPSPDSTTTTTLPDAAAAVGDTSEETWVTNGGAIAAVAFAIPSWP